MVSWNATANTRVAMPMPSAMTVRIARAGRANASPAPRLRDRGAPNRVSSAASRDRRLPPGDNPREIARTESVRAALKAGMKAAIKTRTTIPSSTATSVSGSMKSCIGRPVSAAAVLRRGRLASAPTGMPMIAPASAVRTICPMKIATTSAGVNPSAFMIPTSR